MDPISNVDRLVLILRQRLQERGRTQGASRKGRAADHGSPTALEQVQALAAISDVSDQQLKRALIQGVLADHLGQGLVNEAPFQQVVDKVVGGLEADPALSELMTRVVADLRAGAG